MSGIITLENVVYSFPDTSWNLEISDLSFKKGELTGIIGPNGSGKSTLLRLAGGILHPSDGNIFLKEHIIGQKSRKDIAKTIGYLPQNASGGEDFTAREIVSLGRFAHMSDSGFLSRRDEQAIYSAMESTETLPFAERTLRSLSGGERQRVLLASVLAQEPDILLLDEPESALDYRHKARFFNLLLRLKAAGISILLVTHDINTASEFCGRIILVGNGRILGDGPPGEVLSGNNLSKLYGDSILSFRNPETGDIFVYIRKTDTNETSL